MNGDFSPGLLCNQMFGSSFRHCLDMKMILSVNVCSVDGISDLSDLGKKIDKKSYWFISLLVFSHNNELILSVLHSTVCLGVTRF